MNKLCNMESNILFDNWSLELATTLLTSSKEYHKKFNYFSPPPMPDIAGNLLYNRENNINSTGDELKMIFSLSKFIESLILFDNISYLSTFSYTWKHNNLLNLGSLSANMKEVGFDQDTYDKYSNYCKNLLDEKKIVTKKKYSSTVAEGALLYLTISQSLNIPYNPAPHRADFIIDSNLHYSDSSRLKLIEFIDKESKEIIENINNTIGFHAFEIELPPISSFVFNEAKSIEDIILIATEIRESTEARDMRNWFNQIDSYINAGNVLEYQKSFNQIKDLLIDFQRLFKTEKTEGGQIQIGLSPSITLPFDFKKLRKIKKPVHLVFLKKITNHLFQARNYSTNVQRLFDLKYSKINEIEKIIKNYA